MFSVQSFLCAYQRIGADRVLFAVDNPMDESALGAAFADLIPVSDADKEKIVQGNAERILGL
jgi:predicted TIM-barrel fold metal-dependent hydrolase